MNYRHHYHAGNFADLHKHLILLNLIQYLQIKDSPICIMDTHAGIGLYNLQEEKAEKTKEYETGFTQLIQSPHLPKLATDFLNLIQNIPYNQSLNFYPGSPYLAYSLLRDQDRLVLSELHPEDYQQLKSLFSHQENVQVHHNDAYIALNAFIPPKEKRGLVLIDPPYEKPDEYAQIEIALLKALKKWPTGVYAIWYPLKKDQTIPNSLIDSITPLCKSILKNEFYYYPPESPVGLNGSGMLLINPPWNFEETFTETQNWLDQISR